MKKTVLTFGLLSGLVLSAMMAITMPFHDQIGWDRALIVGYASMLAAFLLIYFGIRSYRDNVGGGSVRFGRAFAIGALIALVSGLCYTATWEIIYFGFRPPYMEKYAAHELEQMRAKGDTQAKIDQKAAELKKLTDMYQNPLVNSAMTLMEALPLGLLVALISAGILSRKRREAEHKPEAVVARPA